MERELFRALYLIVFEMGRARRSAHVVHRDWKIVVVYLWSVLHDRPVCWACDRHHWPKQAHSLDLPSASTMSRRLRRDAIQSFINDVEATLTCPRFMCQSL